MPLQPRLRGVAWLECRIGLIFPPKSLPELVFPGCCGVLSHFQTLLILSRAVIGDTRLRRQWMFFTSLGVLGFIFGGYFGLGEFFKASPVWFGLYVILSLGGLMFMMLFAVLDVLLIRRAFQQERRAVARQTLQGLDEPEDRGS